MAKIIERITAIVYLKSGEVLVGELGSKPNEIFENRELVIWQDGGIDKPTHIPFECLKYYEKEYVYKK